MDARQDLADSAELAPATAIGMTPLAEHVIESRFYDRGNGLLDHGVRQAGATDYPIVGAAPLGFGILDEGSEAILALEQETLNEPQIGGFVGDELLHGDAVGPGAEVIAALARIVVTPSIGFEYVAQVIEPGSSSDEALTAVAPAILPFVVLAHQRP